MSVETILLLVADPLVPITSGSMSFSEMKAHLDQKNSQDPLL